MRNVLLTEPSAAELLHYAQIGFGMSSTLQAEIYAALSPIVVIGDLRAQAKAAATAAGYTNCIFYDWNWAQHGEQLVQTYNDPQGPLGPHGIVVIAFKPTVAMGGSVSVSEFPGGLGTNRSTSISMRPCDFTQPLPWTRIGYNQGIQFSVAPNNPSPRTMPMLQVGTQYFLNVTNLGAADQPEMRVMASRSLS
jgi:hypothetical protein